MNNDNLLNKIKNKSSHRSKVDKKDPLLSKNTIGAKKTDITTETIDLTESSDNQTTIKQLEEQLDKLPKTQRRSGIVLEQNLNDELVEFCRKNKITIETFLEASWTISNSDDSLLNEIVDEAKTRYKQRKEAGQLKRLISTLKKLH